MKPAPQDRDFFIGYLADVPGTIGRFVLTVGMGLVALMLGLALLLARATDDPGAGGYVDTPRGFVFAGTMETRPYPLLRMPASGGRPAHALMLAGEGKLGVEAAVAGLDGRSVQTDGALLKRGDLDMLLVTEGFKAIAAASAPAAPVQLGRWRIAGEICDGKCYAGAMKPGTGLAHKACANLCLEGGLPPVFVTRTPVEGATYFLMAAADGGPLGPELRGMTAVPVSVEGTLERRDDLTIFRIDPASMKKVP